VIRACAAGRLIREPVVVVENCGMSEGAVHIGLTSLQFASKVDDGIRDVLHLRSGTVVSARPRSSPGTSSTPFVAVMWTLRLPCRRVGP
jgi:hypothetical protein